MRFFHLAFFAGAFIILVTTPVLAQYQTPVSFWLSPQFTAPTAMSGSDYHQVSAHYQKQALAGNIGSRSMILSGQSPLYSKGNTQFGTVGLNLIRQESGSSYLFSTTGALFSYNYTVSITHQHHLVGGVQAGYFSRRIDWGKVTTRNQFADHQINPGIDNGERFNDYQSQAFTTNVGLAYYLADARGEQRFHVGAGIINANKGRFTYLENDGNQAEPVKWIVYSQLRLISNLSYELVSNMYWQQESNFNDFVGGLQLNKGINQRKTVSEEHLGVGLYYSPDQSATLAMQLMRQNLLLGMSYSMPFGNRALDGIQNAAEVTLGWRIQRAGKKGSYYGSSFRGSAPNYRAKKNLTGQRAKKAPSYKYKVKGKSPRAFKKNNSSVRKQKFSRKVSSYKSKASRKKPSYRKKTKTKAAFSKKLKYRKAKTKAYKFKKIKRLKPKKRMIRKLNRRRGRF